MDGLMSTPSFVSMFLGFYHVCFDVWIRKIKGNPNVGDDDAEIMWFLSVDRFLMVFLQMPGG